MFYATIERSNLKIIEINFKHGIVGDGEAVYA